MLINDLFHQVGMILKEISGCTEYLLDSFPVPICDNIRIFHVKLIQSEEYRGYIASKKRYFYGVRVQLLTTKSGIPVEFVFLPGSAHDVRALNALPFNLPPGSEVYGDSAYTDYTAEDDLEQSSQISLNVMRKKNSKRQDPPGINISSNVLDITLKPYLVVSLVFFLNRFMRLHMGGFYLSCQHSFLHLLFDRLF